LFLMRFWKRRLEDGGHPQQTCARRSTLKMSKLAAQLQKLQQTSVARNVDEASKSQSSILFSPRQAAQYDNSTIFELGLEGLRALSRFDAKLESYEKSLFSEGMKSVDRTLQTKDENSKLNDVISTFLRHLGPHALDKNARKVLEWLIRRFRIQEFNLNAVMEFILPYHDTKLFVDLVKLLKLDGKWQWLGVYSQKKLDTPLDRQSLVQRLLTDVWLVEFICQMALNGVKTKVKSTQTLWAFVACTLASYLQVCSIDEKLVSIIVPFIVGAAAQRDSMDANLTSLLLLTQFAGRTQLTWQALESIINSVCRNAQGNHEVEGAVIKTLVNLFQTQHDLKSIPDNAFKFLVKFHHIADKVLNSAAGMEAGQAKLLAALLSQCLQASATHDNYKNIALSILSSEHVPANVVSNFVKHLVHHLPEENSTLEESYSSILQHTQNRWPDLVDPIVKEASGNQGLFRILAKAFQGSKHAPMDGNTPLYVALQSNDPSVRVLALQKLHSSIHAETDVEKKYELRAFAAESLLARLNLDDDEQVIETVLDMEELWLDAVDVESLHKSLIKLLDKSHIQKTTLRALKNNMKQKDLSTLFASPENLGLLFSLLARKDVAQDAWHVLSELPVMARLSKGISWKDLRTVEEVGKNLASSKHDDVSLLLLAAQTSAAACDIIVPIVQHALATRPDLAKACLEATPGLHASEKTTQLLATSLGHLPKSDNYPDFYSNNDYPKILIYAFQASDLLLKELFQHHCSDPLPLLVRLWVDSSQKVSVRVKSLAVANVFLQANETKQDYQHLIAPLLICLMDQHRQVRAEACKTLDLLSRKCQTLSAAYGQDYLYRFGQPTLVHLGKQAHLRLIESMTSRKSEILVDANVVREACREAAYLASHVTTCPLLSARLAWLDLLQNIDEPGKMIHLLPLLEHAIADKDANLASLLIQSFDADSISKNDACSKMFSDLLREEPEHQKPAIDIVTPAFYSSLSEAEQTHILKGLVSVIVKSQDGVVVRLARQRLFALPVPSESLVVEFEAALELMNHSERPAAKRQKTDGTSGSVVSVDAFHTLVVLLELLTVQKECSDDLIPILQDVLNGLLTATSAEAGVSIELLRQLTLTGLLKLLESHLQRSGKSALAPLLRVDLMVQCLRVTDNPQTHNASLLLLATIAKILPELVLRNVMPIFTFMGSNMLRHDDNYSIHVIQETLHALVPALMATPTSVMPVVRVFVEALAHIPLHRRMGVFVTLLNALGSNYLWLVTSMLLEYVSVKKAIASPEETIREFAVSLSMQFTLDEQLQAIVGLLKLLKNLPLEVEDDERVEGHEMDKHVAYDPLAHSDREFRQWRLLCVDFCHKILSSTEWLKFEVGPIVVELVQLLMDLVDRLSAHVHTTTTDSSASKYWKGTLKLTYSVLEKVLDMLDAEAYLELLAGLLMHEQTSVKTKALNMLSARATKLSGKLKGLPKVFSLLQGLFDSTDHQLSQLAMVCLATLSKQKLEVEPNVYLDCLKPLVANVPLNGHLAASALLSIASIVQALGPRILPMLPKISSSTLDVLETKPEPEVTSGALVLLNVLVSTLPQFMGTSLPRILQIILMDGHAHQVAPEDLQQLVHGLSHLPARLVLPALANKLGSVKHAWSMDLVADLLPETVATIPREDIGASSTQIYKLYLSAFDCRTTCDGQVDGVENKLVAGFLKFVLKLNEKLFRPMFFKTQEWATSDDLLASGMTKEHVLHRLQFFYKLLDGLLDGLKVIAVPYYSSCLEVTRRLLDDYGEKPVDTMWYSIMSSLQRFFTYDADRTYTFFLKLTSF
jgi:hypothetical protein